MNPLIQLFDLYQRDITLKDTDFLQLFRKRLSGWSFSILEYAPQISPTEIHTARFRIGYQDKNIPKGFKAVLQLLDDISEYDNVLLNRTIFNQLLGNSFDTSKTVKFGIGIDIRREIQNSKVKCYFEIRNYPEKMDQVLKIHPSIESITDYPCMNNFGINIYFDGRTDVEVYPSLAQKDIQDVPLMNRLKLLDIPLKFLEKCKVLFISFEGSNKRILHFYPQTPTEFVRMIGSPLLNELYGNAQILGCIVPYSDRISPLRVILSLREEEITLNNIKHINAAFYYQIL